MSNKRPVEAAVTLAQGLLSGHPPLGSPVPGLISLMRDFSAIEFNVPDTTDSDGYLFQYGKAGWFLEPTFVLSIVRQLEVVDSSGEHEYYVQVQFEFRYPLDGDLEAVGSHSEWWFPGNGASFDAWLDSVERSSIMDIVSSKTPRVFEIYQDQV